MIFRVAFPALVAASLFLAAEARAAYKEPPSRMVNGYQLTPLVRFYFRTSRFSAPVFFNRLIAPAQVNGHATSLIVDTGAESMMIDPHLIGRLGLQPVKQGKYFLSAAPNGTLSPIVRAHTVSIGRAASQDVTAVTAPSPWLVITKGNAAGFSEAGYLGGDFLEEHRAIIDCQRGGLFLKVDAGAKNFAQQSLPPHGWTAVPLRAIGGTHLAASVSIQGHHGFFPVDTGAPFSVLNRSATTGMKLSQSWKRFTVRGIFTQDEHAQIGHLEGVSVGGYAATRMALAITSAWERLFAEERESGPLIGILGMDFLGNNLAFIDYGTRTLYLKRAAAK